MASSLQVMNKRLVLLNPVSIPILLFKSNFMFYAFRNLSRREAEQHQLERADLLALKWVTRKVKQSSKIRCKCNKRECQQMLKLYKKAHLVQPTAKPQSN